MQARREDAAARRRARSDDTAFILNRVLNEPVAQEEMVRVPAHGEQLRLRGRVRQQLDAFDEREPAGRGPSREQRRHGEKELVDATLREQLAEEMRAALRQDERVAPL